MPDVLELPEDEIVTSVTSFGDYSCSLKRSYARRYTEGVRRSPKELRLAPCGRYGCLSRVNASYDIKTQRSQERKHGSRRRTEVPISASLGVYEPRGRVSILYSLERSVESYRVRSRLSTRVRVRFLYVPGTVYQTTLEA